MVKEMKVGYRGENLAGKMFWKCEDEKGKERKMNIRRRRRWNGD